MSLLDSDKEHLDVTEVTDTLCKLKKKNIFSTLRNYMFENFLQLIDCTVAY